MADVNIIVKTFEEFALVVTPFDDLKLRVTEQEEVRIIVPVTVDGGKIFGPQFDFTFE